MNSTVFILLDCVDGITLCQNVTAVKMGMAVHEPLFWQWVRMWF